MRRRIPKYLGSSANPENLSLTIKGALLAIVPIIIMLTKSTNVDVSESDLVGLIEALSAVVAGVMVVYGLARKIYLKIKK